MNLHSIYIDCIILHRDISPTLKLDDGSLVAPGASIVLLAVLPDTGLDVWVPSRKCMVRIPIPIGHGLVLPADTVHRGINRTDSAPDLALHLRLHWYVCRHELTYIPDGTLNEQTDNELDGEDYPLHVNTMQHEDLSWP